MHIENVDSSIQIVFADFNYNSMFRTYNILFVVPIQAVNFALMNSSSGRQDPISIADPWTCTIPEKTRIIHQVGLSDKGT